MERRVTVRRGAAFGAALALTPYLVIKVVWVFGALLGMVPPGEMSIAAFVTLNVVTIGMAGIGILLALALARRRATGPARPLIAVSWIGSGLLVPMLPFLVVSFLGGGAGDGGMAAWEGVLLSVSFFGMGLGLAIAVPLYLRERWPGTVRSAAPGGRAAMVAMAGAGIVGVLGVYWVAGGTLGLAHPGARDGTWRLLTGNTAFWSLAGLGAVVALTRDRPPGWIAVAVAWVSSGLLFAWSAWKLPLTGILAIGGDGSIVWPEHLAVAAGLDVAGILAGLAMFVVALRAAGAFTRGTVAAR